VAFGGRERRTLRLRAEASDLAPVLDGLRAPAGVKGCCWSTSANTVTAPLRAMKIPKVGGGP